MKTTVEISDVILSRAKELAQRRETSLRAIIEEGLLLALTQTRAAGGFVLQDRSVRGKGPARELAGAEWSAWRAAAYGDRE